MRATSHCHFWWIRGRKIQLNWKKRKCEKKKEEKNGEKEKETWCMISYYTSTTTT